MANKNATANMMFRAQASRWDVWAVVLAVLATFLELGVTLVKPTISFDGKIISVTNGLLGVGLLFGALIWALVVMFTPPGNGKFSLILRFFGSFVLGMFLGVIVAYVFGFGQYLLIPAYFRNPFAIYMLVGFLFVFMVIVFDAAWLHNKAYIRPRRAR